MESDRVINCYYDHAANNSCRTNQFCYAEWRLDNFDQLASQSRASYTIGISQIKLDKAFNCYNGKPDPLIIKTICEQTATNTSHIIRRCCSGSDYCNNQSSLLPSEEVAKQQFQLVLSANLAQNSSATDSFGIIGQYSDLPLNVQIIVVLVSLSILCFAAVAIDQFDGYRRRRHGGRSRSISTRSAPPVGPHYGYSIKNVINNLLISLGVRRDQRSASLPPEPSPNISESRIGRDIVDEETVGETPGVGNYDTNSMASREPLINRLHKSTVGEKSHSLYNQPRPEETQDGRDAATLQGTMGTILNEEGDETSSGSGKGPPYLSHRSVSHDIQLKQVIGRGYYGVVWRGELKDQPVAVKIFSQAAKASWERESEIYQTAMLRHKNILGLIAIDRRLDCPTAGFWLVTDFYPMGSLFDFLNQNIITMWDALRMAFSIANGLSHLHVEIFGTRAKPAIAHRDMKSKNILVKNDGTCCIADLGMAIRYSSSTGIVDVPTNSRIGTRRYLAPEILEDKHNLLDFEAVKATDIYALGLVLWEILRRTCLVAIDQVPKQISGQSVESVDEVHQLAYAVDEFRVPFYADVSVDPTAAEMYEVVCVKKIRPLLSPRWLKFDSMRDYTQLMTECWYEKPQARLTALRVRKSLTDIAGKYFNLNIMEFD